MIGMKEVSEAIPTPAFRALSMVTSAYLSTLEHRERDVFAIALLREINEAEKTMPLTDEDAQQAVAWVRALVAEIVTSPKVT